MANNLDAHPLFPAKDEDHEPAEVITVQVYRQEGTQKVYLGRFPAADLTDEEQIREKFGGGTYEIHARNNSYITDKRAFILPGQPKRHEEPAQQRIAETVPLVQQAAQQSQQPPSWIPILTAFMPLLLQWMTNQQESTRADRQAQQALLTAMMQQSQASNAQMITLLTTMNRGGGTAEDFKAGMKFMEDFVSGQVERLQQEKEKTGTEDDSIMETINGLSKVAELIQTFSDNGTPSATPTVPTTIVETT